MKISKCVYVCLAFFVLVHCKKEVEQIQSAFKEMDTNGDDKVTREEVRFK